MFDLMFSILLLKNEANSSHDLLESSSEGSLEGGSVSFPTIRNNVRVLFMLLFIRSEK